MDIEVSHDELATAPDDSATEGRDAPDMVCFDVDAQCAWRSQSPAVALDERVGATKMALSPPMPQGPMEEKFSARIPIDLFTLFQMVSHLECCEHAKSFLNERRSLLDVTKQHQ